LGHSAAEKRNLVFYWPVNAQITASDYVDILGIHLHLLVQLLFPNNDAIFQDSLPIHTARIVQSWFQEHKDAL
jgi:hypothetical protein